MGAPPEYPAPVLLRSWPDLDDPETWRSWDFRGAKHTVVKIDGQPVLLLDRREDVVVEIPVEADLDREGLLTLLALSRKEPVTLAVGLRRGGKQVAIDLQHIESNPRVQEVSFNLASAKKKKKLGKIDRILLSIPSGKGSFGLRSVALEQKHPWQVFRERAFGGFDLITIGGDARRATFISPAASWRTTFEVLGADQELCLSYAQPEEVRSPGLEPELHVELQSSGGRKAEKVLSLGRKPNEPARWHHASIPLDDFVGDEVTAIFRFQCSDGDGMAVITEPCLLRRGKAADTVLLITSDTHRADHVGFLSEDGDLETETIDRLAAAGVSFVDAVSSVNNTTPSHVALFTGLSPRDTGIVANAELLSEEAPTLAEAFRDAGYVTLAAVSATPVVFDYSGLGQGFDRYSIPARQAVRRGDETLEQMLDWLPEYEGAPLFVWVHLYDAHGPYDPPEEFKRMYYPPDADPFDVQAPGAQPELAPYWDETIADPDYTEGLYKGEITYVDQLLGELLAVDRIWNGVIAFTADHGESLRVGSGRPFDHQGLSPGTLDVPLIFKAPGLSAGIRRDDPVQQIDIGRTLLNLSGLDHVEFPGRDVLQGNIEVGEPRFAVEANGFSAAVYTDKWMLRLSLRARSEDPESRKAEFHAVRLYDLEADPDCLADVGEQHPELTRKNRTLLIRWLGQGTARDWRGASTVAKTDIERQLAELGYVSVPDSEASDWFDPDCGCDWCRKFE